MGVHAVRQRGLQRSVRMFQPAVGDQADELLRVQRIALGALDDRPAERGSEDGGSREVRDELGRLFLRQRREVDRLGVALTGSPSGAAFVQLAPRGAHDQQRNPLRPLGQVLEEREQGLIGPVQVLEYEDRRVRGRESLQEAPPRREQLLPLGGRRSLDADERRESLDQPRSLRLVGGDDPLELVRRDLRRVGFEDARLGLDDLAEGPERDASPYGGHLPCRHLVTSGFAST